MANWPIDHQRIKNHLYPGGCGALPVGRGGSENEQGGQRASLRNAAQHVERRGSLDGEHHRLNRALAIIAAVSAASCRRCNSWRANSLDQGPQGVAVGIRFGSHLSNLVIDLD